MKSLVAEYRPRTLNKVLQDMACRLDNLNKYSELGLIILYITDKYTISDIYSQAARNRLCSILINAFNETKLFKLSLVGEIGKEGYAEPEVLKFIIENK